MTSSDRFCLDGNEVVAVNGEYGKPKTEYRTRVDLYSKIVSNGLLNSGPQSFTVHRKDGMIDEYGTSSNSRFITSKGALFWAISRRIDRHGNSIHFGYERKDDEFYPKSISYGGNDIANLPHYRTIRLIYGKRKNPFTFIDATMAIKAISRLERISVLSDEREVWSYRLNYQDSPGSAYEVVSSIDKCDGSGRCMRPTFLEYTHKYANELDVPVSLSKQFTLSQGWGRTNSIRSVLDVNNDGYADIIGIRERSEFIHVSYGSASGFGPVKTFKIGLIQPSRGGMAWETLRDYLHFVDINGDSFIDIMIFLPDGIRVSLGMASGFQIAFELTNVLPTWNPKRDQVYIADANCDAFPDIVAFLSNGVWVSINTVGNFSRSERVLSAYGSATFVSKRHLRFVMDLDKDQCADVVGIFDDGVFANFGTPSGFSDTQPQKLSSEFGGWPNSSLPRSFHDMNGDGYLDLVGYDHDGVRVALGAGRSLLRSRIWLSDFKPSNWRIGRDLRRIMDVNEDGIPDFVGMRLDRYKAVLGTAAPVNTPNVIDRPLTFEHSWILNRHPVNFADTNADGTQDVTAFMETSVQSFLNRSAPILLSKVSDGYGYTQQLTWRPLTHHAIYNITSASQFPSVDIQGSKYVVAEVTSFEGVGGKAQTSYAYENGRYHLRGLGFLGFEKRIAFEHSTGLETIEHFSQDYTNNLEGLPAKTIVRLRGTGDSILSSTTYSWTSRRSDIASSVFQIFSEKKSTRHWSLTGRLLSNITTTKQMDQTGNITSEVVATEANGEHYVSSTENVYADDVSRWLVGQVVRSTRTHAHPFAPPKSRTVAFEYERDTGALVREILEPGGSEERSVSYERSGNVFGLVSAITRSWKAGDHSLDFNHVEETFKHNDRGLVAIVNNPVGHVRVNEKFDHRFNTVTKSIDENKNTTLNEFDSWGRRSGTTVSNGTRSTAELSWCEGSECPSGAVFFAVQKESGKPDEIRYFDNREQIIRTETPGFDGRKLVRDYRYNNRLLIVGQSRPYIVGETAHWYRYEYDPVGRLIRETAPDDTQRTMRYDGFMTDSTNASGAKTRTVRNALNQTVQIVDSEGNGVRYRYDAAGDLVEIIDSKGNASRFDYDVYGKRSKIFDPNLGVTQTTYNGMGLPSEVVHEAGLRISYTYDRLGRKLTRAVTENGQRTVTSSWEWDQAPNGIGKLSRTDKDTYMESYGYDRHSRVKTVQVLIDENDYQTQYIYDNFNRVSRVVYPSGVMVIRNYNQFGYLEGLNDGMGGREWWHLQSVHPSGIIKHEMHGNGVAVHRNIDSKTARLIGLSAVGSNELVNFDYTYNELGNLKSKRDSSTGDTISYKYDSLNRLTGYTVPAGVPRIVAYDEIGNITVNNSAIYDYGAVCEGNGFRGGPHAVSSVTGRSSEPIKLCYDDYGNAVRMGDKKFSYEIFNKPTAIRDPQLSIEYQYGPNGQRTKKTVTRSDEVIKTYYVGVDYRIIQISGNELHVHMIADGVVLIKDSESRRVRYLYRDQVGSVIAVADEAGNPIVKFRYDPWGKVTAEWLVPATSDEPAWLELAGFTGHEYLEPVHIIHMGGRIYSPEIGRFLSGDPLVPSVLRLQALNRYSYVENNPLIYVDPTGYFRIEKFFESLWHGIHYPGKAISGIWHRNRHILIPVIAVAAAAYTGGMAGNAVLAAYGTSASAVAAGSTASIVSGIAAGAASGATLGAVSVALYGGNLEHVVQSAALGAVGGAIGGGVAGFIGRDMVGRAVGGGLNGFIQTGRLETAGRGMVAGMVAENLWMEAFYTNKVANISIGLARETIRGYIIDEKAGAERGAINYAVMNGTAHAVGHIFFQKNMSFDAKRGIWKYDAGKSIGKFAEALAIGDVVFYDKNTVGSRHSTYQGWLWDHEAAHRDIQSSLGVAYLPTHITSQWIFQEGFQQEAFMERGIWMGGKGYETRPP